MKIGMIGLGKMGANMTTRLIKGGHEVVVYDLNPDAIASATEKGATGADSLEDLVIKLTAPRAVWVMVPAGKPTDATVAALSDVLDAGDVIVDGGNSNYHESVERGKELGKKDIHFVDVGTSGGVWGLTEGYSMMVGGTEEAVHLVQDALKTLAPGPDKGWGHVGPGGSGHYVKMVHNGIEYGLMQAYAEGYSIMKHKEEFGIDLHQVSTIWQHGSVIRSWLLDLIANAVEENPEMTDIAPFVPDSGEGRWTVFEAIDQDVPAPVITLALLARLRSRDDESFADRLLSAMRNQFGGHKIHRENS
ncbi:MAG: decarboxylating 6-phosphogluconate dehydrogenase [Rhodothermales bacterium]|nr:decarboxylating 6-phosphogluconate dehydrogenase [Rhodothermales bacterium]